MAQVRAAGGVVVDQEGRIALIHRPRYEDWSLPKGKLTGDEDYIDAAVREVQEETSLVCRPIAELSSHEYVDRKGRPKVVRWWRMEIVERPPFRVNDEVDELRWATPDEAEVMLTYEHDRELVREAVGR
jgi:8-oxo-dGTP diphosphatase